MKIINQNSPNIPQQIAQHLEHLKGEEGKALTCCINRKITNGKGYLVGIVQKGERGYVATALFINTRLMGEADQWVRQANEILFPELNGKELGEIIISSFKSI